ncbi:MAG: carbohydrate ABC transporter permease [Hungatella hathewayi]|nr:carbohydrate ABC transporter permease [Hungatella hathewayi]
MDRIKTKTPLTAAKKKEAVKKLVFTALMFIFVYIMIFPLLWMVSSSLKSSDEVFRIPFQWLPETFRWSNYAKVWNNQYYPFGRMFLNSTYVVALSIGLMLLISSLAAYAFAKMEFWGKNAFFFCFLATMMIPTQLLLIPRFIVFNTLGLYNKLNALVLCHLVNVLAVFLLRQQFVSIPKELSEAAKIDGAGHFTILWRVMVPLAKPAFMSLLILSFVWFWNDYESPLIFIRSKELYTIPLGLQVYKDDFSAQYELMMAGSTIAIVPILTVFLIFQKHFIAGLANGSVKG